MRRTRAGITGLETTAKVEDADSATAIVTDVSNIVDIAAVRGNAKTFAAASRAKRPRAKAAKAVADEHGSIAIIPDAAIVTAAPKRKRPSRAKIVALEATVVAESVVMPATMSGEAIAPVAPKRKRTTRAKTTKLEPAPKFEIVTDAQTSGTVDVPSFADEALPVVRDASDLAKMIDSLRGRTESFGDTEPQDELPGAALELFERCANDYRRESNKLVHRRHRIGTLVYPATPEQTSAIAEFFVRSLGLRIVDIDVRSLGESDDDISARLSTLSEPMAHIVALRGLGPGVDPRVFAAIESADVDVLVLGFAEPGATLGAGIQRRLKYRIDLQQAYKLEVVLGCFDDLPQRPGPTNGAGASSASSAVPWKGTFFDRVVRFFRPDARTAG